MLDHTKIIMKSKVHSLQSVDCVPVPATVRRPQPSSVSVLQPSAYSLQPSSVSVLQPSAYSLQPSSVSVLQPSAYSPQPSSPGIALVMVLGILSVMVIMAVAFAISMRTERVAAGNYADSVRARQLVQSGLARALNDLALKLGTNGLMSTAGGTNYPPWAVTNSYTNAYTNTSVNLYLVYATNGSTKANEATNFVPRALWTAAVNADFLSAANHWLPFESVAKIGTNSPTTNLMGRVKYLILNCSGLLDANFMGGAARGMGTNPMEIAIGNLGDIGNANAFLTARNANVRYETLDELAVLNASSFIGCPSNFTVYSRALPGYWSTNPACVATQVNVAGANAITYAQITNAFYQAGCTDSCYGVAAADILYNNLIDYVDTNSVPGNLVTCVEPAPMINEVAISNRIEQIALNTYRSIAEVDIEWWYPFIQSDGAAYQLQCTAANFTPLAGPLVPPNPPLLPFNVGLPFVVPGPNAMGVIHMQLNPSLPVNNVNVTFTATLSFNILRNGQPMDQVPPIVIVSVSAPVGQFSWTNRECIDPRFNAYLAQWTNAPNAPSHSLGKTNNCTIKWWQDYPAFDTNSAMYVANTNLHSVGELGSLAYAPWKTIKLYGPNLHRVLDVFGISTNTSDVFVTNMVYRGRVNCNSNSALDASAAVFAGMPVDAYPGQGVNTQLMAAAQTFAATIFSKGAFTNLSDIGRNLGPGDFPGATTELEREAYFRNAFNLLNVRQNLFTIIIEAQVASGGNIPGRPIKQRAAALVWRDPYTGAMFVRSIKWLRD